MVDSHTHRQTQHRHSSDRATRRTRSMSEREWDAYLMTRETLRRLRASATPAEAGLRRHSPSGSLPQTVDRRPQ